MRHKVGEDIYLAKGTSDEISASQLKSDSTKLVGIEDGATVGKYVDRGDVSDWDFTSIAEDFITDGAWHELDLSSIIPEGTKAVHVMVYIQDNVVNSYIRFMKKGNLNVCNIFRIRTQVGLVLMEGDGIISCDADRKIEYCATNTVWNLIVLQIRGWWI